MLSWAIIFSVSDAYMNRPEDGNGHAPLQKRIDILQEMPGRAGDHPTQSGRGSHQLMLVIVRPQRGQMELLPAQVVPQLEQVLTQWLAETVVPGQTVLAPLNMLVAAVPLEDAEAPATGSNAQLDCGNNGRLKNSSHTASANSSQGGISQKP